MGRKLEGRKILVTGAAGGMGRGIAEMFAAEDAMLALVDQNGDAVELVAKAVGATAFTCDVADAAGVAAMIDGAAKTLGGLDGLVNAAGVLITKPFAELDPESWQRMISVNLTGPYNIIRSSLSYLRRADQATIVNIASISGFLPMPALRATAQVKAG